MISIIVINENSSLLFRTLMSVYMQNSLDKIKLFIIHSDKTINKRANVVKDELKANETYVLKKKGLLDKINDFLSNSSSEYVFFMRSGDTLFDKYSISHVINEIGDNDIYSGNILYTHDGNSYYDNNNLDDIYGKAYRISFFVKNGLYFPMLIDYEKLEFNQFAMYFYPTIYYSNALIYSKNNYDGLFPNMNLEWFDQYIDRRVYLIDQLIEKSAGKDVIAMEQYDLIVKAYYRYSISTEYKKLLKKIKEVYKSFVKNELYMTNADKTRIFDSNMVENTPKISMQEFLKEVQHD